MRVKNGAVIQSEANSEVHPSMSSGFQTRRRIKTNRERERNRNENLIKNHKGDKTLLRARKKFSRKKKKEMENKPK